VKPPPPDWDTIPAELRELDQWVLWRFELRENKWTKEPFQPNGNHAASTKEMTWSTFADVRAAYEKDPARWSGIGCVVSRTDPYCGVDLDHCIDLGTGEIHPVAQEIINRLNSYTEVTPSGDGLRVWVRAELWFLKGRVKSGWRSLPKVELYDRGRYFTLTGRHLANTPTTIGERQRELEALHAEIFAAAERHEPAANGARAIPSSISEAELLEAMFGAKNGAEISALWNGDTAAHGGDDSAADLALCNHLAWWTNYDRQRTDALFRQSRLMRPKWDGKRGEETYGEITLDKAFEGKHPGDGWAGPAVQIDLTHELTTGAAPAGVDTADTPPALLALLNTLLADPTPTVEKVFTDSVIAALAHLKPTPYAAAKAKLKAALGKDLNLNDLEKAVSEKRRLLARQHQAQKRPAEEHQSNPGLPDIIVNNRQHDELFDECIAVLQAANDPPQLFVRTGALAMIREDEDGRAVVLSPKSPGIRLLLARAANYFVKSGEDENPISTSVNPPKDVVHGIADLGAHEGQFPPLVGVTQVPVLRPDGTILTTPGYDPLTRLVYRPEPGLEVPRIPDAPTPADIQQALATLADVFADFPFEDQASQANLLALLLSFVTRPAVATAVPLCVIDSPQAGTGKSLLAQTACMIGTGRFPKSMTAPADPAEWRKQITAALLPAPAAVMLDNLNAPLMSGDFAAALTLPEWSGRLLGTAHDVTLPQRVVWLATGNNVALGGDIPRRCYTVRINAKAARPFERDGWRYPELLTHVTENRGHLLAAVLTLARAWYAAGCPEAPVRPLGSFEEWTRKVGGILHHAGVPGFLANLPEQYDRADVETPQWDGFLHAIWDWRGESTFSTAQLVDALLPGGHPELRTALPDSLAAALEKEASLRRRLGRALAQRCEQRFPSGLYLASGGKDSHTKAPLWRIAVSTPEPPSDSGFAGFAGSCGVFPKSARVATHTTLEAPNGTTLQGVGSRAHEERLEKIPQNPANPANLESASVALNTHTMADDDGEVPREVFEL
jgi:hypothetical protein